MLYGVMNFMQCLLWIPTEFCAPVCAPVCAIE